MYLLRFSSNPKLWLPLIFLIFIGTYVKQLNNKYVKVLNMLCYKHYKPITYVTYVSNVDSLLGVQHNPRIHNDIASKQKKVHKQTTTATGFLRPPQKQLLGCSCSVT